MKEGKYFECPAWFANFARFFFQGENKAGKRKKNYIGIFKGSVSRGNQVKTKNIH